MIRVTRRQVSTWHYNRHGTKLRPYSLSTFYTVGRRGIRLDSFLSYRRAMSFAHSIKNPDEHVIYQRRCL